MARIGPCKQDIKIKRGNPDLNSLAVCHAGELQIVNRYSIELKYNYEKELRMKDLDVKKFVREGYAEIARQGSTCCGCSPSCCGSANITESVSKNIGYSDEDLEVVPDGANLGLGCGNPVAMASLKEGETVLDLGSGAGFDCFLAAQKVGKKGRVIGIDMTPEMIERARANKQKGNYDNVEFRLGEIENLPVADNSTDVIISNCVINLSPDKGRVFQEAYRVLKPGGRMMVSDIVLLEAIPEAIINSIEMYVSCIAGASQKADYLQDIQAAGFKDTKVVDETPFPVEYIISDPTAQAIVKNLEISPELTRDIASSIVSVKITATK
jgi:SAM-dependent methyltransferase